jgi:hypothetical protein
MKSTIRLTPVVLLVIVISLTAQQQKQETIRLKVFVSGACNDNATGAVVESSLRDSILSSSGYTLVHQQEPGTFLIALACVNAGSESEGWTAVGYHYGLIMKANPETIGIGLWNPTLGVFTVGHDHARAKGQELFAKFDNAVNR